MADLVKESEDVLRYYSDRAAEYDITAGYLDESAEKIRKAIKQRHQNILKNREVLEIACGTGYWTAVVAKTARSILATDASRKMISIAQRKYKHLKNVVFQLSDAYSLENISGNFNAAYAHWWWSHIPKSRIRGFLRNLHKKLLPKSLVLFIDHLPAYFDKKTKVIQNKNGDRIEERILRGEKYFVIKNLPTKGEIQNVLTGLAENVNFQEYEGFWELHYTIIK